MLVPQVRAPVVARQPGIFLEAHVVVDKVCRGLVPQT